MLFLLSVSTVINPINCFLLFVLTLLCPGLLSNQWQPRRIKQFGSRLNVTTRPDFFFSHLPRYFAVFVSFFKHSKGISAGSLIISHLLRRILLAILMAFARYRNENAYRICHRICWYFHVDLVQWKKVL